MARTNKYASLNFNQIYDKKTNNNNFTSPSPSKPHPSYSRSLSSSRKSYFSTSSRHGGMVVLSRPSPSSSSPSKPHPSPTPPPSLAPASPPPSPSLKPDPVNSDSISLRPQGRIGSSFPALEKSNRDQPSTSTAPALCPKSDKFVPPHLRPGYVAREQMKPEFKNLVGSGGSIGNSWPDSSLGNASLKWNREVGRPTSGNGGCGRRTRGFVAGEAGLVQLSRSRSGGHGYRPSSSW